MNRKTLAILNVVLAGLLMWAASSESRSLAQGGVGPLQYQGRLTDPTTGDPVADGDYTMTFRLYSVASGGSALWTETKDVSVQGGLFSTALGDTTSLSQTLFNGQALWLGVKVGGDAETTPRQQILPVAYALYTHSAPWSGLTGVPAGFADGVDNNTTYSAGTGLTLAGATFSLNTAYIDGRYWSLTGNAGTTPGTHFLGTTDNQALELWVNNARALRLEPHSNSPNVIGGHRYNNVTSGVYGATIGGGGRSAYINQVTANLATIGGGLYNTASGWGATVGGGDSNAASGEDATVGGGGFNLASGDYATVGGGDSNTARNGYATVPGGHDNVATGDYSFAAGRRAIANNPGCFVWGDSANADVECNNDNRWVARASGGVWFWTNSTATVGSRLTAGGSAWGAVSARQLKENFALVDGQELLARLAENPITTWNYKSQDPSIRHIGPMAEDFNALLDDLGGEGEGYINSLDADGVALAAIQGLYHKVQELEAENAALRGRLDSLEAQVAALKRCPEPRPEPEGPVEGPVEETAAAH